MARVCDYFTLSNSPEIVWHRVQKNPHSDPRPVKLTSIGVNAGVTLEFTLPAWRSRLADGRAKEYTPFEEIIP